MIFFTNDIKSLIKETLNKFFEDKEYKIAPQDYSAEFRQTGSGKSIFGKTQRAKATEATIQKAKSRILEAIKIARDYRTAYANGVPDEKGVIYFKAEYQGKIYTCQIPPQFKSKETAGGQETDYRYYFNSPEIGDGAMQVSLDMNGKMTAQTVRPRPDMLDDPNLSSASDSGYSREYQGTLRYFNVKVGAMGKYQSEVRRYSIFPTPAIDAQIKANIAFNTEIMEFLKGGADYTFDEKGKELADKMEFNKKIEKIRKDAENIIGKPISSNKDWLEFKAYLIKAYGRPGAPLKIDISKEVDNFIEKYKTTNIFKPIGKPEIGLPKSELDAWEKEQQEKMARIAAAKARMKK